MKTTMKKNEMISKMLMALCFMFLSYTGYSQAGTAVLMEVKNMVQTNANTFTYDVFVTYTGTAATFALRGYSWGLNTNTILANGGTLSHSFISRDPSFSNLPAVTATITAPHLRGGTTTNAIAGNEVTLTLGIPSRLATMSVSTTTAWAANTNPFTNLQSGLTPIQVVAASGKTQCVVTTIITPPGTSFTINGLANAATSTNLNVLATTMTPDPNGATPFLLNSCTNTTTNYSAVSCDFYTWPLSGNTYTSSGTYTHTTLIGTGPCIHTDILNITINPNTTSSQNVTACNSYFWSCNNVTYTTSGVYTCTSLNAFGCVNTSTLNLTINHTTSSSTNLYACNSYVWPINGNTYTTSGIYTATSLNVSGCVHTDSLILTISKLATINTNFIMPDTVFCIGGTIPLVTQTASPNTGATLVNQWLIYDVDANCNEIGSPLVTLYGNNVTFTLSNAIFLSGHKYTLKHGIYSNCLSYSSTKKCFTIPAITAALNVSACNSYTWALPSGTGNTYTTSGAYTKTSLNAAACVLATTLNLTINNSTLSSQTVTACNSYLWSCNGVTYTTSGTYTCTSINASGCLNTATLQLTINYNTSSTQSATACNTYTWALSTGTGNTYTVSGVYTKTSLNASGCVNTATLNLTINYSTTNGNATVTACNSYTWACTGFTYTASGTYLCSTLNQFGCTNVATLNLTISHITINSIVSSPLTCFGDTTGSINLIPSGGIAPYTYFWNDSSTVANRIHLRAGIYHYTVTDNAGCTKFDSIQITSPPPFIAMDSINPVYPVTGQMGSAYMNVSGGNPPYNYLWSTGNTTSNIATSVSGAYNVVVSDVHGCSPFYTQKPGPNTGSVNSALYVPDVPDPWWTPNEGAGECSPLPMWRVSIPEVFLTYDHWSEYIDNLIVNGGFEADDFYWNSSDFANHYTIEDPNNDGNIYVGSRKLTYTPNAPTGITGWKYSGSSTGKSSGFDSYLLYIDTLAVNPHHGNPTEGKRFVRLYGHENGIYTNANQAVTVDPTNTYTWGGYVGTTYTVTGAASTNTSKFIHVTLDVASYGGFRHPQYFIPGGMIPFHASTTFQVNLNFGGIPLPESTRRFKRETLPPSNNADTLFWVKEECIAKIPTNATSTDVYISSNDCFDALAVDNVVVKSGTFVVIEESGANAFFKKASIDSKVAYLAPSPYTYHWSNGATTDTTSITTIGTYSVSITDANNQTLYYYGEVNPIYRVAGTGNAGFSGNGGQATNALLNTPSSVTTDTMGNIYIADTYNNRIRKIDTLGIISTYAGVGTSGFGGDAGPAISAQLSHPMSITIDESGNLYISDQGNHRIRKIDTLGIITTIAGIGIAGYNGDGVAATLAQLNSPSGIAVDKYHNIYFSDQGNHRIRKIDANGIIHAIAGTGIAGYSGNNGPATMANLQAPKGISVGDHGTVFFADQGNNTVHYIGPDSIIHTLAGNETAGFSGDDALANSALLNSPTDIQFDKESNLYICDMANHRIRKISAATNKISTVVGTGTNGYSGDGGMATLAQLNSPVSIHFDRYNKLFFADNGSHTIRRISPPRNSKINLKLFIEGYWDGVSKMVPVLSNQFQPTVIGVCDTIKIELHNANSPYNVLYTTNAMLQQNGVALCNFSNVVAGNYYVAVKHRNAIETWSATPISFNGITISYDFTTAASQAYGSNQTQIAPGIWALYSGDVNQDENIDLLDLGELEFAISSFEYGYSARDLNGDGNVDLLDTPYLENNISNFIYSNHP